MKRRPRELERLGDPLWRKPVFAEDGSTLVRNADKTRARKPGPHRTLKVLN